MSETLQIVALDKIVESKTNPRRHFDEKSLKELAESIKQTNGVLNPILVRPQNGKFELVCGARRFRATKIAGLPDISAIVREIGDEKALEIQVTENLQREDVHPLDEAIGYEQLMKRFKYDVDTIAATVGKSSSYVYQRLKLADLIEPARKAFFDAKITPSHAILIARLQPKDQQRTLAFALKTWQDYEGEHEYINPINPEKEDVPITEYRQNEGAPAQTVCSVKDLDDFIHKRILLDLREAAFDKKDEKLVPKAGSCITCPKRSGFNKELFNDITKSPDICTDPVCFAVKQEAHFVQLKAALKKEKKRFIELTEDRIKPEGQTQGYDGGRERVDYAEQLRQEEEKKKRGRKRFRPIAEELWRHSPKTLPAKFDFVGILSELIMDQITYDLRGCKPKGFKPTPIQIINLGMLCQQYDIDIKYDGSIHPDLYKAAKSLGIKFEAILQKISDEEKGKEKGKEKPKKVQTSAKAKPKAKKKKGGKK